MKKLFIVLSVVMFVAAACNRSQNSPSPTVETNSPETNQTKFNFSNSKKSAHYESNTPEQGSILAAAPINVVINFNFDLASPSEIKILKDGKDYGVGNTLIDSNKLTLRRNFDPNAPDGLYKVDYTACWPDRSCHTGYFEFAIDRTQASAYEDKSSKTEVTIRMSEIMFKPKDIKIKAGTKVTWINDDEVVHYVNTDSHPGHTYYPAQNSQAMRKDDSYSVIFTRPGIYPYHCSSHAATMTGNILVY